MHTLFARACALPTIHAGAFVGYNGAIMNPRYKIVLATLVAVIIVAGGYLVPKASEKKLSYRASSSPLTATQNTVLALDVNTQDSDKDGLADWEEVLWKTDPKNHDTDGDGMSDGDEVKANRDPSVKGAGNLSAANTPPATADDNATTKLASDILITYSKLKAAEQAGVKADVPTPEELIKANTVTIQATQYLPLQFSAVADGRVTAAEYAQALAGVLGKYSSQDGPGELEIVATAINKNDKNGLTQLKTIAERYRSLTKELLAVKVPEGALLAHTGLVNAVSKMAEGTDAMQYMFTDPAKGIAALKLYNDASTAVAERIIDLETYFDVIEQNFPLP